MHPDSLFTGTLKSLPCLRRAPGQADDGNTGQGRIPLSLHGERRHREPRNKAEPAMQGLLLPQWRGVPSDTKGAGSLGGQCRWSHVADIPVCGVYCRSGVGGVVGEHPHSHPHSHLISFHPILSCPIPSYPVSSPSHPTPAIPIPPHSHCRLASPHLIPSHLIPHHCTACLPKDLEFSLEGHSKARGPLQALHAPWRAWTSHRCPTVPNIPRKVPDGHKQPRAHW